MEQGRHTDLVGGYGTQELVIEAERLTEGAASSDNASLIST